MSNAVSRQNSVVLRQKMHIGLRENIFGGYTWTKMAKTQQPIRRRIIVVVVPPVDELDLVGPLKVLGAANRLAGKPVYEVEVVTNRKGLVVQGEEGLLSFAAHGYFEDVKGEFDSV